MRTAWDDIAFLNQDLYEYEIRDYGTFPDQKIYLSLPKNKRNFPVIVWYHGGGLSGGERECPLSLWNGEYAIAEVRYRLSGKEFKGTDCIEDAAKSLAWILKELSAFGGDPEKVLVGGMSAGCYLAAMVGMAPHLLGGYGFDFWKIAGLVLVSGQMSTHFQIKEDLGYTRKNANPVIDEYAPMFYASAEIPPCIFVTGGFGTDMPARAEENAFFAAVLRSLGHKDAEHFALCGHNHGGSFDSCDFLINQFIQRILNGK